MGIWEEKVNICGGVLILGYLYGVLGVILVMCFFYESKCCDMWYVIVVLGSGGGIGIVVLFEVIK